jgi:hypothetical protein
MSWIIGGVFGRHSWGVISQRQKVVFAVIFCHIRHWKNGREKGKIRLKSSLERIFATESLTHPCIEEQLCETGSVEASRLSDGLVVKYENIGDEWKMAEYGGGV